MKISTRFSYIVGFHDNGNYHEEMFQCPTPVVKGDYILWPENDTEYEVFRVIHTETDTHIHVQEL